MSTNPKGQRRKYPISQRVNQISPSGIRRFFDLLASLEGVISLGVGEPDFATPWHICEAAISSLGKGYTMYTSNLGMPELRQELAKHLKNNYNLEYDPDSELLITVGVSEALDLAMRATLNPGDEVIMPDPAMCPTTPASFWREAYQLWYRPTRKITLRLVPPILRHELPTRLRQF